MSKQNISKIARTTIVMILVILMAITSGTAALAADKVTVQAPITIQPITEISIGHEMALNAVQHAINDHGLIEETEMEDILNWASTTTPLYTVISSDGTESRHYELVNGMSYVMIRKYSDHNDVVIYGFTKVSPDGRWRTGGYVYKLEIATMHILPVPDPEYHIW